MENLHKRQLCYKKKRKETTKALAFQDCFNDLKAQEGEVIKDRKTPATNSLTEGALYKIDTLIEENILKTLDRTIHANDYKEMKNNYDMRRGQVRVLKQEINDMMQMYQGIKNSPQAASIKLEIENKQKALRDAQDRIDIMREKGRQGVNIDPQQYREEKAFKQGAGAGAIAGGLAGLGTGAYAMNALSENHYIQADPHYKGPHISEFNKETKKNNDTKARADMVKKINKIKSSLDYQYSSKNGKIAEIRSALIGRDQNKNKNKNKEK